MSATFEGRLSDSPYVEIVWRGRVEQDYMPVCPADSHWNFLFTKYNGKVSVTVEGAVSRTVTKNQFEGAEFLVIKLKHGIYMPAIPASDLVDGMIALPESNSKTFWLNSTAWQLPGFDNAETFVERLVRDGTLVCDPVVAAELDGYPQAYSSRTVRRRFWQATGLSPVSIRQIERAKQAAVLLEQGVPILDAVYQLGYADQPHLTRSLKRFYGQTPAQIATAAPLAPTPQPA